jgi:hypothetical protein
MNVPDADSLEGESEQDNSIRFATRTFVFDEER